MKKTISIIGSGVGGLSAAMRLAHDGYKVNVFEKLSACGGRNNLLEDRGFKFDMGPSFVMMPDFFEELFSYCGKELAGYLDFKPLDVNYKIFYPDNTALTIYKDVNRTKEELERVEEGSSVNYDKFVAETERIYKLLRPLLYKCFTKKSVFNYKYWPLLKQIRALDSYWGLASQYFKSEKLRYAFTFEAMFMGVSPFDAPAFYSIISYADQVQKIHHAIGGMYTIPLAIERIAKEFGANFNYNAEAADIHQKGSSVVFKIRGEEFASDRAVVNADYAYTQAVLLNRKIPHYKYSCSTLLIYMGLKKKLNGLAHHNLFFARDLIKNLDDIFKNKVMPLDASFYVHLPTVTDKSLAPEGKDILYLLIPVPNLENTLENITQYEERVRKYALDKVSAIVGENVENLIEVEHRFYPKDFIGRYNIKFGATFGLAHNLMQSAFFRPANFDSKIRGLYYVGASVQPGGGLPVVIASSRIAADLINSNSR